MGSRASTEGLLIIGHGTRNQRGVGEFHALVEQVRRMAPGVPVAGCFLEMARPSIAEGVQRLVDSGVRRIRSVPLMLFAAGHVCRDIPAAMAEALRCHPGVELRQGGHLGSRAAIVRLSRKREAEATAGLAAVPAAHTVLVLAGRGSRDPRARREMQRLAELRAESTSVSSVEVGFLAMTRPWLADVLDRVAGSSPRRVVVQPHLLFPGRLADQVRAATETARQGHPDVEFVATELLGPDRLLAEAVWEAGGLGGNESERRAGPCRSMEDEAADSAARRNPATGESLR